MLGKDKEGEKKRGDCANSLTKSKGINPMKNECLLCTFPY
jgi:hypothetical protein